ncbi:MAG: hypothetical protein LUD72_08715, partial [Bacteroidales bacterium]|nr:hypothetical protein [Bacteroidales bacterium]
MTYLFFDIECCDGVHICEFGYVLTDEKFNVTERDCITMNPEASFNLTGRPGRRDLILAFTEDQYFQSPTFPTYYERIKNLLTAEDRLVVGYAPLNDVFFLNNACSRYKLDKIDYPFFDCQRLYEEYRNIRHSVSLDSAQEDLNAEERSDGVHRSDQDSLQTMNLFVTMLKNLEMTVEDIRKLCPKCFCDSSAAASEKPQNPTYKTFDAFFKALDEGEEDLSYNIPQFFSAFQNVVKPAGDGMDTKFKGKLFCLSEDFGRERAKEAFLIVQLIANGGGKFSHKAFDCDMFIASDAEIKKPRYRRYEQIFVAKTYCVPIYSLDEFYS